MDKQIFIINGMATSGKDTFVELVNKHTYKEFGLEAVSYSSVAKVKEIMKNCGWDGISKTEKDRKFMSDLKLLLTEYNDLPMNDMKEFADVFWDKEIGKKFAMLFYHIREPLEISKAVKEFNAKTILIKRDSVKHITSNMADDNVYNYDYDIVIENNGTLEELENKAIRFINDCIMDTLKERY